MMRTASRASQLGAERPRAMARERIEAITTIQSSRQRQRNTWRRSRACRGLYTSRNSDFRIQHCTQHHNRSRIHNSNIVSNQCLASSSSRVAITQKKANGSMSRDDRHPQSRSIQRIMYNTVAKRSPSARKVQANIFGQEDDSGSNNNEMAKEEQMLPKEGEDFWEGEAVGLITTVAIGGVVLAAIVLVLTLAQPVLQTMQDSFPSGDAAITIPSSSDVLMSDDDDDDDDLSEINFLPSEIDNDNELLSSSEDIGEVDLSEIKILPSEVDNDNEIISSSDYIGEGD